MKFKIELSGGLELLFNKNKKIELEIEEVKENFSICDLILKLKEKIVEKQDFFITKENQM
jgi:hypothetical protein